LLVPILASNLATAFAEIQEGFGIADKVRHSTNRKTTLTVFEMPRSSQLLATMPQPTMQ